MNWIDRDGVRHDIATMDPEYAAQVLRHIWKWRAVFEFRNAMHGIKLLSQKDYDTDTDVDDIIDAYARRTPEEWFDQDHKVAALKERAAITAGRTDFWTVEP